MKAFPLDYPNNVPGIYALRNKSTRRLYVGQTIDLMRRYSEWRAIARGSLGGATAAIRADLTSGNITDWEYLVIEEMPGATRPQLLIAEEKIIFSCRQKYGDSVINADAVPAPSGRAVKAANQKGAANKALTKVTYQGNEISYAQARELLGSTTKGFQKRLAGYRERGITEVSVELLIERGTGQPKHRVPS